MARKNKVPTAQPAADSANDHLTTIVGLLRAHTKNDFGHYKEGTLGRRIQRRMSLMRIDDMEQYVALLNQNMDEIDALYDDLLIGVTKFFREPDAWRALEKEVIGPLVRGRDPNTPIRVWTPACATGEEAYSVAMVLMENLQKAGKFAEIHIFASDIDQDALAIARAGVYPEGITADVSPERLRRFFVKDKETYRISKEVRETVVFAEQNVLNDPPFSKLDLISCRNLLIYLEPEIQKKILDVFHFALRENGCLFLGNASTVGRGNDLLQPLSRKWRIYRRVGGARHAKLEFPMKPSTNARRPATQPTADADIRHNRHQLASLAEQALIAQYAPACVVVNRNMEVLFLNGPVDDYLQLPNGELTSDVIAMTRTGLRAKLRSSLLEAFEDGKAAYVSDARIKRGSKYCPIRIRIEPLRKPPSADGFWLVAFEDTGFEPQPSASAGAPTIDGPPRDARAQDAASTGPVPGEEMTIEEYEVVIRQMEYELAIAREDLQATTLELATSSENFKATTEEATSINEELQSTNEELETSKEELQSMNEELQTVNVQLEAKIGELEAMTNDLSNLLASIDYATLFLDRDFHIKRFTPAAAKVLRVLDADIGRPFKHFARNIADEALLPDAERVLNQLTPVEKEFQDHEGRSFLRRIVPYRTADNRIDGVVITIIDISQHKRDVKELEESRERFARFMEHMPGLAWIKDVQGRYVYANDAATDAFQTTRARLYGKTDVEIFPPETAAQFQENDRQALSTPAGVETVETLEYADGEIHQVIIRKFPIQGPYGQPAMVGGVAFDITDRLQAEEQLRRSERELNDFFENTNVGLHWVGSDGTILRANQAELDILGYERDEYVGRHIAEFHVDQAVIEDILARLMRGEPLNKYPARMRCKDGSIRDMIINSNVFFEDGKFIHTRCFTLDVTDRKQAEAALEASESRFRALTMNAPAAIFIKDLEGRYTFANTLACQVLARDDVTGLTDHELMPAEFADTLRKHDRIVMKSGKALEREEAVEVGGVKREFLSVKFPLFDAHGEATSVCGVAIDIAERKRAEEQLNMLNEKLEDLVAERTAQLQLYHAAVQTTPAAVIITRWDGTIITWNAAAGHLFGYTPQEAVGKNIEMLLPPDRKKEFAHMIKKIQAGDRITEYDTVRRDKSGAPIDVAVNMSSVRDSAGELIGACKIIRDLRERNQLEQEIAKQGDHERRHLAEELHDGVGQSLTGLSYLASSLSDRLSIDKSPHTDLCNQLVDITDQVKVQIHAISRGLHPVADADDLKFALAEMVRRTEKTFNIPCRFEGDREVPGITFFAAGHLFRIAQEAVHNTVKHARAKQIVIHLKRGSGLTLAIEDDGVGIPKQEKKQAKGKGMRTMRHRANLIGAALVVESAPGKGTKVKCTVPIS